MIDFIEYVVAELKSKRLSTTNAAALVRQFARRASEPAADAAIHPLLHRNTSDLGEQRYSSRFIGEEFFLADHQVKAGGQPSLKVLPGVAYLEMARAAIEQATPERPEPARLELRNIVWAQPIVVTEAREVNIALLADENEQVDFEVYSDDSGEEVVHCQGRAVPSREPAPARLDLAQLRAQMGEGSLQPEDLYAACARMGLLYGAGFQSVAALHRGSGQLLAELRLPNAVADEAAAYVLHPSLMDGALQAAVGLIETGTESVQPRLPFALETLRIFSPCTAEMVAWVRYAEGSQTGALVKLDIDLCDGRGNVCVQMRGLAWRALNSEIGATPPRQPAGSLIAVPGWQAASIASSGAAREFQEHRVMLYGLPQIDAQVVESRVAGCRYQPLNQERPATIAQRYSDCALACFETIQAMLRARPQGKVLFQLAIADDAESALLAGLSGLLRTAALENPRFTGQVIVVPAAMTADELCARLQDEKTGGIEPLVRIRDDAREVLRWQELATEATTPAFKDDGVYLITGGLGAIGRHFTREILAQTRGSRVVLTGRAALTEETRVILEGSFGNERVSYRQLDLGDLEDVERAVAAIRAEHGQLTGILHCAGMIADDFILNKTAEQFRAVLAPKVAGTVNLDHATRDAALDFFVLFAAVAGTMGNLGQADYAAANGFMDQFAAYRNRQVAMGQRQGRTLSIDWPLWREGGMVIDDAARERLRQTTGMQAMETAAGVAALHRCLAQPHDQMLVVEGELAQVRRSLLSAPEAPAESRIEVSAAVELDADQLVEKTQDYLRRQLSGLLKVPAHQIDPRAALENYGIDSILAMKLTNQMETSFGSLSKTLFFEYQTIRELADYFIANHAAQLGVLLSPSDRPSEMAVSRTSQAVAAAPAKAVSSRRFSRRRSAASVVMPSTEADPIAIIGLSGRYPEAVDIAAYWENLRDGKDCITEVPGERWDWREYLSEDRGRSGRHYSKWGGFIAGVDEFDPLFFNISPVEAELIDPQERLFLQHAWMAVEDAGYTRASLQVSSGDDLPGQVGVYVGAMYTEYQLFGVDAGARGKRLGVPGSAASIANRVSYAFNLHGPSMTLDSMCSSSLTAIHLACEDLKHGRTSLAIAGGVNVSIHPNKYLVLSAGQFISGDGHCQSFGEGGDGYIPGEGVGVVVLKRLSEAERDGDHIYGVIRGSALNHGGKTNGYSVPNPQAQAGAISRALAESKTDPRSISYIEAHGTGTKLGDPIEIAALSKAFRSYTEENGFCLIGSAKSNIGHCESAAGIAGLTKVLLQMQHRQIVPSLHSAQLNPHIDFAKTPFIVNQTLRPWEPPVVDGRTLPRIAGISSFGAGGSNAHLIVEEYQAPARQAMAAEPWAVVLSARTPEQLEQKAADLLAFVRARMESIDLDSIDLASLAYTLQVGREPMEERLAFFVTSTEQLAAKLEAYVRGERSIDDVHQGQVKRNNETLALFSTDADLRQAVDKWLANRKQDKLLELWVKGLEVDWTRLHGEARPPRISVPTYPFARERFWVDLGPSEQAAATASTAAAILHPLLHSNTSDLSEQRYTSTFSGEELFLTDHQVALDGQGAEKVLPAVAYLEMARAAVAQALPARAASPVIELRNTVWAQPIVVRGAAQVSITLLPGDDDQIEYEVYSQRADEEIVHCQGRVLLGAEPAPARIDLARLAGELPDRSLSPDALYAACERMGLRYGPSFRTITSIERGNGQLLARLRLPEVAAAGGFVLHPSLMDGSLQAAVGLLEGDLQSAQPRLPFALETLRVFSPCAAEMVAWVRCAPGSQTTDAVLELDIDLCDEQGNVCAQMRGLSARALSASLVNLAPAAGSLLAAPVWDAAPIAAASAGYAEHHVVLCELPDVALPALDADSLFADPSTGIARLYNDYAVACFERIQVILGSKRRGKVLFQLVVPGDQERALLAGLSALLKTATLENPQFIGQLIVVSADIAAADLERLLRDEQRGGEAIVRYERGVRQVVRWDEIPGGAADVPVAFHDRGAYLITGGTGALGLLFAREILTQTDDAHVVLTGRSTLSAEKQALIATLGHPGRVSYRQVDLGDLAGVERLIAAVVEEHGALTGILHSAGIIADRFILNKTSAQFREVLAPKVTGTVNLDRATRDVALDFFVLFSSIAGAAGNLGQADYAAANGFVDQFAAYRNRQVAAGERRGRTRSINWPLWQSGGMSIDAERRELLRESTGMQPMQTATGMAAFHRSLALPHDQLLVVEGDLARIRRSLLAEAAQPAGAVEAPALLAPGQVSYDATLDTATLVEKTQEYLRKELSGLLKMPSHRIDSQAALEEYGIDSVLAMKLTNRLEKTFGSLSKTLFFEYRTIEALAGYFIGQHAAQLTALLAPPAERRAETAPSLTTPLPAAPKLTSGRRFQRARGAAAAPAPEADPIAIIGISGRYPEAVDLEAYWENLREGKDCVTEVPKERWDWREYFSEDRALSGRHFSKWGGFMAGVDEFDPLFFNISPAEAELIDPQERLFLQHAWMAVEDAGYTRAGLQVPQESDLTNQVGVYAGVMYNEYQLFGAEASAQGRRMGLPGSTASIANRVSYVLNLHGPSVTLDTMCSSSLTAIHFACQDLKSGRTTLAIAGGVNVSIHPNKYLVLSAGQFISGDGHCQSFGEGGDGYIPGEGVGVVVLKRLSEAERDGDHIYGVIRGSALNHGGKTNGYSVPNPQAQASAVSRALAESKIDARHVSYIEAHGTGTKLGDPIEIAALSKAFRPYTEENGFCLIGSAKSNIGHCESAAGIAGLTKVLLQMQHRQIVPSLHSAQLNPHIDFAKTPFIVNQTLRPWEPPVVDGRTLPRIAGISSFGAGGSNAHLIVEEYQSPAQPVVNMEKGAFLLSARTPEQLEQKVRDLLAFVRARVESIDLASLAYTLQVGRESMDVRLALIASSAEELADKLQAFAGGERAIEELYQGEVRSSSDGLSAFSTDADLRQTIDKWLAGRKLAKLIDLWVKGLEVDWSKLYGEARPRRSALPAYPFARERHWIDLTVSARAAMKATAAAVLHPLLHCNTSDLSEERFRSVFTGEEFFLADHQVRVGGAVQKMLPAVAQLEMARAAVEQALPDRPEAASLELRNVVWASPVVVSRPTEVSIALDAEDGEAITFEIFGQDGDVHCQGRAVLSRQPAPAALDLAQLRAEMAQGQLEPESIYAACSRMGLIYGASFQGITALHRGTAQVLAQLRLPTAIAESAREFVLHPSLMDGALQACVGLLDAASSQPRVPFALETLRIVAPCTVEMLAWVRVAAGSQMHDPVVKLDIDVCDERGNVCAQLRGLSSRVLGSEAVARESRSTGTLLAVPVWQSAAAEGGVARQLAEHHVIACNVDVELPAARCIVLQSAPQATIADRYSELALAAFERIQSIVTSRPRGNVLVQIVVAEQALAGLSGLLKTAALENPQLAGQLVIASPDLTAGELGQRLNEETRGALDPLVRLEPDGRTVLRWQEVTDDPRKPAAAFKDGGVYLITGGTGGLGLLFAREILEQAPGAHVVLTGRAPLTGETQARLDSLGAHAARASYRQLDLGDLEQMTRLVADLRAEHGRLDGILHSAGMVSDHLIPNKTRAEFGAVLAPKVAGAFHLDLATRDVELDLFVLFSSVAGAAGNYGQADYAAANGFMDQFAAHRNRLVAAGERHGRTRSINWPLWREGGMGIDPAGRELLQQTTGMRPMETAAGMDAFHRSLALPHDQLLVVDGDLPRIRRALLAGPETATAPRMSAPLSTPLYEAGPATLLEKTQDYLRQEFSPLLKLPAQKIDPQAAMEKYGIDSILAVRLTNQLEKSFGSLSKTLFFEYQTIAALAGYFIKSHPGALREKLDLRRDEPEEAPRAASEPRKAAPARRSKKRFRGASAVEPREIAIVGLAGRYPQANDLREFWRNLQAGRDCITEIPLERWDHARFFDPDPDKGGKSYSKWGGFIADVDKFDPLFFGISPKEAELIDPQERLFLETAWETIEDAGYTKESIAGSRVGVFVGVMWSQYELFGAESVLRGNASLPGSSHASIANRVSYYFDFRGPSLALDTMCSSSLTAIHLACEELRRGEIDAALAGGVNVSIHPYKYLSLSQGKFAASDGRCRSFGAGGDGYVPGEGVGAVLLKPLEHALRDGDQIYAVIKSSSVNHGGKTNGYTVPNPNAQGDLIRAALKKADIDPKTLGYIEAHGTGTSLGDPIEIAGLLQAFDHAAEGKQFCPIGSVKSNIGHLESAAGIAAVTKVLLQIRHKQLVPSLHAESLNPNIDFAASPFYVQTELADWAHSGPHPRRVGVSSFGAGGANAHLILEEYEPTGTAARATSREAFVLSARNESALRRYAGRVVAFLDETDVSLAGIAYTSQVGRTPMDARLVVLASGIAELREKLSRWADGATDVDDLYYGNSREAQVSAGNLMAGAAGKAFLEALLAGRDLDKIAQLWVLGAEVDWSLMHRQAGHTRVSLPTYPFDRERFWVPQEVPAPASRAIEPERRAGSHGPQRTPQAIAAPIEARAETYLKTLIGEEIKLAADRIGSTDPLESFGLDSVMINRINARLEGDLGTLPKTLLYEQETVRALAAYLVRQSREALVTLFGADDLAAAPVSPAAVEEETVVCEVAPAGHHDDLGAVAIIGIHGLYPHSDTPDEFWNNLKDGRHLIDVVPRSRWDAEELYDPDPAAASEGKIYCKWGGFLDDYDKFDPHFFKISTAEAKMLDPQERLFLQSVWAAIEDAGYTRERLRARFPKAGSADVGVFVGVTTNTYHLWAPEERMRGNAVSPTAMPWSIANRVSYFFDFNGPSLPVDTACSSALVAIHLACESLRTGECQVAIAGGVNLYLHPAKYHSLCQKRMVSLDGKCHSYGAGDDGFVPGEGVGTVVLKPLHKAIEDGDRIHAVIRGSAHDHSGRSNGYSAPNPNAQAALISRTLKKAGVHPDTIGYVEGHGTGTQLGDSIEIAALTQAFQKETDRRQFCPIGSVKANIGHSESAAGIAGLAKVILQMQQGQLAPSIHSDEVNPNIEFQQSPFYLQHGLTEWASSPAHPRRALINSFGAGGVNACLVVEEFAAPAVPASREAEAFLLTLSARNEERLREYAGRLLAHLRSERSVDLAGLCYSLQTGREAMEERLAVVVRDVPELIDRLDGWTRHDAAAGVHRGSLRPRRGSKRPVKLVTTDMGEQSLIELAARWTAGEEVEWETLHALPRPSLVSAPTYPFARERYWVSDGYSPTEERTAPASARLHPLIAYNSSTLKEVSFSSSLSDTAFYAVDHQVAGEKIFPGAGFLEMACIAGNIASEQRVRKMKDIVWMRPLSFRGGAQSLRTELRRTGDGVEYAISSLDDDNEPVVHSEGRLAFGSGHLVAADDRMPPQALKALCTSPEAGAGYYERLRANGLHYGPAFQTIQELYVNHTFVMAKLKIAEHLRGEFGQFILHPGIIDGALQTIAGLVANAEARTPYLPFALDELELIKPLSQTCYAYAEWADPQAQNRAGVTRFNIRLLNESGEVLVKFRNLYVRPLAKPQAAGHAAAAQPVKGRLLSLSGGAVE
jgi:polyketide synthase PksN